MKTDADVCFRQKHCRCVGASLVVSVVHVLRVAMAFKPQTSAIVVLIEMSRGDDLNGLGVPWPGSATAKSSVRGSRLEVVLEGQSGAGLRGRGSGRKGLGRPIAHLHSGAVAGACGAH
jgi:hypothetical protein